MNKITLNIVIVILAATMCMAAIMSYDFYLTTKSDKDRLERSIYYDNLKHLRMFFRNPKLEA